MSVANEKIVIIIEKMFKSWRLQNTEDDGGEGYPLIDALVPPDGNLAEGKSEVDLLIDGVLVEVLRALNIKDTEIKELKKEKCKYCEEGNKPWWDMTWMHTIKGSNIDCEGDYPKPLMPNGGDFYDEIVELHSRIEVLKGALKVTNGLWELAKPILDKEDNQLGWVPFMQVHKPIELNDNALKPQENTDEKTQM